MKAGYKIALLGALGVVLLIVAITLFNSGGDDTTGNTDADTDNPSQRLASNQGAGTSNTPGDGSTATPAVKTPPPDGPATKGPAAKPPKTTGYDPSDPDGMLAQIVKDAKIEKRDGSTSLGSGSTGSTGTATTTQTGNTGAGPEVLTLGSPVGNGGGNGGGDSTETSAPTPSDFSTDRTVLDSPARTPERGTDPTGGPTGDPTTDTPPDTGLDGLFPAIATRGTPADVGTTAAATPSTDDGSAAAATATDDLRGDTYRIESGDTFASLAIRFYGDERYWIDIRQANPDVDPRSLQPGQDVRLPPPSQVIGPRLAADTPAPAPTGPDDRGGRSYTVETGDTLTGLASRFYGDSSKFDLIYDANRDLLATPDRLTVGDTLQIPPLPSQ